MADTVGSLSDQPAEDARWLPQAEYDFVSARVPIVCVDLLPVLAGGQEFVLIERHTYAGGRGLNLVGGGVFLDEPIVEALDRHVVTTLGAAARLDASSLQLVGVFQYFKEPRDGELHDPRKNAVAVTYAGTVAGPLVARGEALTLRSFPLDEPPELTEFGFGQGTVVYEALAAIGHPTAREGLRHH